MKKNKSLIAVGIVSLISVQAAIAGPLYGTVRIGGAVAPGLTLIVACPGFNNPGYKQSTATTDRSGGFSMLVAASGRCEMKVQRGGETGAAFAVFVSNNPLRFDFSVDQSMNATR